MDIRHAYFDILSKLELAGALGDLDGADLTSPIENILEEMTVDGTKMLEIEISDRDTLTAAKTTISRS
jgi:hypothetical protein